MQLGPTYSFEIAEATRVVSWRATIVSTFEDTTDGLAEAPPGIALRWEIVLIRPLKLNGSGRIRVPWKSQIFNTPFLSQVRMYLSEIILMGIFKKTKQVDRNWLIFWQNTVKLIWLTYLIAYNPLSPWKMVLTQLPTAALQILIRGKIVNATDIKIK